jgi:vacuolar-type H+-ATPase subunit E/Vma4
MYWSFCTEAEYEAQQAKERALCGHAARLQAAYKELLVEHRALAEKEVLEGLSEPEERRLAEVRQKLEHCEADLKQSWCQQQIVVARKNLEVLKAMLREARRNSGGEQQC